MTSEEINFLPGEPHIMPHQDIAFNGDKFICEEFLKLRDKYNITTAVETGSATGGTTKWLCENFDKVHSIEINEQYLNIAKERCRGKNNLTIYKSDSPTVLSYTLNKLSNRTIYFLDAHWGANCPLLAELKAIANAGLRPIIAIHDFQVPGSSLGFDSYNNQPFTIDWIKPALAEIYNEADSNVDDYTYYYNSDETATGAKRGIIYILPL